MTDNKGIYLHDVPFGLFMKYFFSGSYEDDFISDRYSAVMTAAKANRYYLQSYVLSYDDISKPGDITKNTKTVSIKLPCNLDISKTSKSSILAFLGIDTSKFLNPSIKMSSTLVSATSATENVPLYEISLFQNGLVPVNGISLYNYYAVINGRAHYSVSKTSEGKFVEFEAEPLALLDSTMSCDGVFYDDPDKYSNGRKYAEIKKNGKVIGKIYMAPEVKTQKVDDSGNLAFLDRYSNNEVYFKPGSEPKSPIEKYNDYMRDLKLGLPKNYVPVYGNLYLVQKNGKLSLRYSKKVSDVLYFMSNENGTVSVKSLHNAEPFIKAVPLVSSYGRSIRSIRSTPETGISGIVPPQTDTIIETAPIFNIANIDVSIEGETYSDSSIKEEFSETDVVSITGLKSFLQTYSSATDNSVSSSVAGRCYKSYGFVSNLYKDGYYRSKTTESTKIAGASALLGKMTSDSMSGKELISAFSSLGLFLGVTPTEVGSDSLKKEYLDSATKIASSVIESSGNAYSGSYVGTDYIKSLYLYAKGIGESCSSMLGYSLAKNQGTSFHSGTLGIDMTGFVAKSDLSVRSVVHSYAFPSESSGYQAKSYDALLQKELTVAKGKTDSISALRKIRDYDDYELNSKRINSMAADSLSSATMAESEEKEGSPLIEGIDSPSQESSKNDLALTKDMLCDLVAQYLYSYDASSQSATTSKEFFMNDFSSRFSGKIAADENEYKDADELSDGNIVYSFGKDSALNLAAFKKAILNKTGRNN